MTRWSKMRFEKILLLLAGAALLASAGWSGQRETVVRRLRTEAVARLSGADYAPGRASPGPVAAPVWLASDAPAQDAGWNYEVFTPPVISFNAATRTFTVTPPAGAVLPDRAAPWAIELVEVKREPFGLRLAGYFGGPEEYVAAFSSPDSAEILLARVGHRLAQHGLRLVDFAVKKVPVEHGDAWPVHEVAAFAVLRDEPSGREIILDNRVRQSAAAPLAVCQFPDGDARLHELHQGDSLSFNAADYRVERIQLDPPEVTVVRRVPGSAAPETKILRPSARARRPTTTPPPSAAKFILNRQWPSPL